MSGRKCFVPSCKNSSKNCSKTFIQVPNSARVRQRWLAAVNSKSSDPKLFCCELHFDLENDCENWFSFKYIGQKPILKYGIVPHKFLTENLQTKEIVKDTAEKFLQNKSTFKRRQSNSNKRKSFYEDKAGPSNAKEIPSTIKESLESKKQNLEETNVTVKKELSADAINCSQEQTELKKFVKEEKKPIPATEVVNIKKEFSKNVDEPKAAKEFETEIPSGKISDFLEQSNKLEMVIKQETDVDISPEDDKLCSLKNKEILTTIEASSENEEKSSIEKSDRTKGIEREILPEVKENLEGAKVTVCSVHINSSQEQSDNNKNPLRTTAVPTTIEITAEQSSQNEEQSKEVGMEISSEKINDSLEQSKLEMAVETEPALVEEEFLKLKEPDGKKISSEDNKISSEKNIEILTVIEASSEEEEKPNSEKSNINKVVEREMSSENIDNGEQSKLTSQEEEKPHSEKSDVTKQREKETSSENIDNKEQPQITPQEEQEEEPIAKEVEKPNSEKSDVTKKRERETSSENVDNQEQSQITFQEEPIAKEEEKPLSEKSDVTKHRESEMSSENIDNEEQSQVTSQEEPIAKEEEKPYSEKSEINKRTEREMSSENIDNEEQSQVTSQEEPVAKEEEKPHSEKSDVTKQRERETSSENLDNQEQSQTASQEEPMAKKICLDTSVNEVDNKKTLLPKEISSTIEIVSQKESQKQNIDKFILDSQEQSESHNKLETVNKEPDSIKKICLGLSESVDNGNGIVSSENRDDVTSREQKMEIEEDDDAMDIDDTVPNTSLIIERKSDEFPPLHLSPTPTNSTDKTLIEPNPEKDNADIVILDDDEMATPAPAAVTKNLIVSTSPQKSTDKPEVKEIIDLVETSKSNRCLNSNCPGTSSDLIFAPDFCLSYYRVKRSKSFKEEICPDCYAKSVKDFDKLSSELQKGNLIFSVDYPIINETLQIEDSDEELDQVDDEADYLSEDNFNFIKDNIDDIVTKSLMQYDIDKQLNLENDFVRNHIDNINTNVAELTNNTKDLRKMLDQMQIDLYTTLHPTLKNESGIQIIDDYNISSILLVKSEYVVNETRKSQRIHKPVSYVELDDPGNSNSPKVTINEGDTEVEADVIEPTDLPPNGPVVKHPLKIGEMYYISREAGVGPWIRARLLQVIQPGQSYKLIELKQQKERIVSGKSLAYFTPSSVRLTTGARVIAVFKLQQVGIEPKKLRHDSYYAGVVAEPPSKLNKYRYLIFFDIGYSLYVGFKNVHLVLDCSPNVWDDMPADSRPFIQKYLQGQDRPMVKLNKDQTVKTEYNGKWWLCTVTDVDCSLVQVYFDSLNRIEWLYRGCARLNPLYKEEQAANNRQTAVRGTRKLGLNESGTVVQYTRNNDLLPPSEPKSNSVRAVARKSTTRPQGYQPPPNIVPFLPEMNNTINSTGPTSKIMYFTPRDQIITKRMYRKHSCSDTCKQYLTHNFSKLRGHNPLSKPLLCGWARLTQKSKGKKEIIYKAPCGRILRNIAEVHCYLSITKSEMTVDLFDFNHMVRCLAEFSVECAPDPKDLSRGVEQVPIPVINGISNEMLDFCNYSIKRVPMDGVHMNLDPEFLCGCDCEDDCLDKTKCSCWRLTLEGAKFIGKDVDPNSVGYIYRRLPEQVVTGIYECNSRCKCSSTCLNRVVQHPMSLKLQVFKTHNRGWGIRCLNDVPQGSFICIYAGTIHTEQMANSDGVAYGDEYFAELDYIEAVERYKEDYEKEAFEDEDYKDEDKSVNLSPDEEDDEPKFVEKMMPFGKKRYGDDNDFVPSSVVGPEKNTSIRTRLRTRNAEEIKKDYDIRSAMNQLSSDIDTVTISDDEDEGREILSFNPKSDLDESKESKYTSVRDLFGRDEYVYVMDAKNAGNIGRFLNHSCSPNVFVQNVFVDTQDPRFPWVSFFSSQFIRAGTELTWNYNYDIGSVPGRVLYCHCASLECKGRLL